jgi:Protein of unknown function (DUF3017)
VRPAPRGSRLLGPWLLLAAGTATAVILVVAGHLVPGANVLGGTLAITAVLRAVLPAQFAGAVAARSRVVDVLLLSGAAVAALVLAATLPRP